MRKPQLNEIVNIHGVAYYVEKVSDIPYIEYSGRKHYAITLKKVGGTYQDVLFVNSGQIELPEHSIFDLSKYKMEK